MNRKLPTVLILLIMALVGAMYWVDMTYYTDAATGFVTYGTVWMRYAILALPLLISLLGLRTVGARGIAALRVPSVALGVGAALAGVVGVLYGVARILFSVPGIVRGATLQLPWVIMGAMFLLYGGWMLLFAHQLFTQKRAAPTRSAIFGMVAALPFCVQTIYRVLVKPTTLYRVGPFIKNFSALFAMLWFGVLLRALYIALTRKRVRWMYSIGIYTFLLATCLEMPQVIFSALRGGATLVELLEGVNMGAFGLIAGLVSVAIAGQSNPGPRDAALYKKQH